VDPEDLLDLFDRLVGQVVARLDRLADWGPSGLRPGQYHHDVVADEIIVPGLRSAGLAVLSEESGKEGDEGLIVVVDPIDGSTNASLGIPWYAASLCAVDDDGPLAALVVNLATGDRYRAVRGRGARRDRSPLRFGGPASDDRAAGLPFGQAPLVAPSGCLRLPDSVIGFSGYPPIRAPWRQFRVLGAAALDLCAVADGTLDGYVDVDRAHGVWDYLGAVLVCQEAGAVVTDWAGGDLVVLDPAARRGPVAGATAALADELVAMAVGWT
jgi:fructose-1,6-bisphosphatase/inositol monophosphatase family enzyme